MRFVLQYFPSLKTQPTFHNYGYGGHYYLQIIAAVGALLKTPNPLFDGDGRKKIKLKMGSIEHKIWIEYT